MAKESEVEVSEREEHRAADREHWSHGHHPKRRASDAAQSLLAGQTVVAVAVVLTICYFAKLVIVVLLVSILLAFILAPLVGLFERFRVPRPLGAFLALLILLGVIYGALYFGYSKAVDFSQQVPKYSREIQ